MKGRTPFQECGLCKEILRGYQSLELNPCSYGEVTARARGLIFNERSVVTDFLVEQVVRTRERGQEHTVD